MHGPLNVKLLGELTYILIPANEYVLNVWSCNVFVLLYKCLRYLIQGLINVTGKWFYVIIFFTVFNGLVVLHANVT